MLLLRKLVSAVFRGIVLAELQVSFAKEEILEPSVIAAIFLEYYGGNLSPGKLF
jgi:hypothetical protein